MQTPDPNQPQQPFEPPQPTSSYAQSPQVGAPIPPPTDQMTGYNPYAATVAPGANNSGMGAASVLPEELKGLNGGAFLLSLFWSIAHSTWIGLLCLVPYLGWIMCFILLFKGNEFAWQNRKWESIEQFKKVQQIWLYWGIGVIVVSLVLGFGFGILGALFASRTPTNLPQ